MMLALERALLERSRREADQAGARCVPSERPGEERRASVDAGSAAIVRGKLRRRYIGS